jgi:chromosome segregation ATPase
MDNEIAKLILNRLESIEKRFDQVDAKFDQVDARFDQVDAKFDQVDARFDQVDARFDQVDARFDQVDKKIETEISKVHTVLKYMQEDMTEIKNGQSIMAAKQDKTDINIGEIKADISDMKYDIRKLIEDDILLDSVK